MALIEQGEPCLLQWEGLVVILEQKCQVGGRMLVKQSGRARTLILQATAFKTERFCFPGNAVSILMPARAVAQSNRTLFRPSHK